MGDERRWAARYQFLEELWRERDRIVFDPELEQALHAGVEGSPGELLGRLLPGEGPDARVWMSLTNERRAAMFARARPGTVFVGLDGAAELATDEDWQVALIWLPAGSSGRDQLSPDLLALLDVLGDKCSDDPERTVVIAVACEPGGGSDQTYERLADLVDELFGDARIYGLASPTMAAAYDFGRLVEDVDADADSESIEVDTTLGSDPQFDLYLAVIGDRLPAKGLTFIELASDDLGLGRGSAAGPSEEIAAMRAQLAEAQRRGDVQAIERLSLLEQLEQAEERAADPRGPQTRPTPAEGLPSQSPTADSLRLDAVLAREQALRWELEQVRGELGSRPSAAETWRARPVEALEAETAALRARLADAQAEIERLGTERDQDDEDLDESDLDEGEPLDEREDPLDESDVAIEVVVQAEPPARSRERQRLRGRIDQLLLRLERGAELSALELHRELVALRRML